MSAGAVLAADPLLGALSQLPADALSRVALSGSATCHLLLGVHNGRQSAPYGRAVYVEAITDGDVSRLVASLGATRANWKPHPGISISFVGTSEFGETERLRTAAEYSTLLTQRVEVASGLFVRVVRPAAQFALWGALLLERHGGDSATLAGEEMLEVVHIGPPWHDDVRQAPAELRVLIAEGAGALLADRALFRYVRNVFPASRSDPGILIAVRHAIAATVAAATGPAQPA